MSEDRGQVASMVAAGDPIGALKQLAALIEATSHDSRLYDEACRALFAALSDPTALANWRDESKPRLYRRLLLQRTDADQPPALAHQAAARLTSGGGREVAALVDALAEVLLPLAMADPIDPSLLQFLLVTREQQGDRIAQERLSAHHRQAFPGFTPADLVLPYSAIFNPAVFGRNCAELLDWSRDPAFLDKLAPHHLLLIDWLGRPARDLGSLTRVVQAHADEIAARSLALRYDLLVGAEDLAEEARALGQARADLPKSAADGAVRRLTDRRWMAARAIGNLAASYLPLLASGQRKVRVAVCVSGQLRGFRHVLPNWQRTLFAHADCTFFVHTWEAIGRSGGEPFRAVLPFAGAHFVEAYRRLGTQEGHEAFLARYPALFATLKEGATVTTGELSACYGTRHVVVDDEAEQPFAGFSNQQKMHYKIWAADRLSAQSGEPFDLVVRIRPDLAIRTAAFDWRDLARAAATNPLVYVERPYGVHYGNLMIGDQFAVGSPAAMRRYASAWELYPRLMALRLAGCPPEFTGHVSLAQTCWMNGLALERAPVRFGSLQEPEPISSRAILAALEQSAAGRMDAIDRALIAAARADLR